MLPPNSLGDAQILHRNGVSVHFPRLSETACVIVRLMVKIRNHSDEESPLGPELGLTFHHVGVAVKSMDEALATKIVEIATEEAKRLEAEAAAQRRAAAERERLERERVERERLERERLEQAAAERVRAEQEAAAQEAVAEQAVAETETAVETAEPEDQAQSDNSPVAVSSLKRVRYVAPKYPRSAERRNLSGWVDLVFTVAIDGSVKDITVRNSEPGEVFVNAAIRAVEKWEFEPVVSDGAVIEKRAAVRMMFAIE